MLIFYTYLKVFIEKYIFLNNHRQYLNNSIFSYCLSTFPKRNYFNIVNHSYVGNEFLLDATSTMSKRVRSKSLLKPKKVKRNLSPNSKRSPIPRSCKHSANSNFVDYNFDFLSLPTNKVGMNTNQKKMVDVSKDKKKEDKWSSDEELDVVYDLQEEKKNKIYEVITVMSDDETPNKITYERLYADKPEDRTVEDSEIVKNAVDFESNNLAVGSVQKVDLENENTHQYKVKRESIITKTESSSKSNHNNNDESDDDVVCLAVIDAKTKAEMKKASIEEICLSSDSESDITPTVAPLRLKIPAIPNYANWSVDQYLGSVGNDSSFGINNTSSNFSFGFRNNFLYPYVIGKKKTNVSYSLSDWESSSSPKRASSEELSLGNTPEPISTDESSLSITSDSNHQPNIDNFSSIDNENISSPSSSSDEENKIYWKADRQSRRKRELMYEEFTSYGKKVHQGEITVDSSTSLTFKVMSYNVLAQNLLEEHRYLYKHHDRRALSWARRWALIYNDIKEENPEILCLQEVENIYLTSHYTKLHDLGYNWIYKKRTSVYEDGVAIFYKKDLFTEDDHAKVEYFQPGVSVLDRDNVGLVVRLRVKKSPSHAIVVSTTHLLYNPRRSDVKLAQIQMLLAEIDRLAFDKENFRYYPVILTGDFNLKPRNGVYKLLTEGQIKYVGMSRRNLNPTDDNNILPKVLIPSRLGITDQCQHIEVLDARNQGKTPPPSKNIYHSECNKTPNRQDCHSDDGFQSGSLQHTFNFRSVYPHVKEDGQKEASTHHDHWITVDYIFYSCQEEKVESPLHLLSRLRLPTQGECERLLRFLPNFAFGSDHLPLVGKFLLKLH